MRGTTDRLKPALLAAGVAFGGATKACLPSGAAERDAFALNGRHFGVLIQPVPAPLRLDAFFRLDIRGCALDGGAAPTRIEVDARMPAHGHGMNYRPSVRQLGPGHFIAEGLLFHMRGEWTIDVLLQAPRASERLRLPLSLE